MRLIAEKGARVGFPPVEDKHSQQNLEQEIKAVPSLGMLSWKQRRVLSGEEQTGGRGLLQ